MKRLILGAIALVPALGLAQSRVEDWKFTDRETIQRSFTVGAGAKLDVDNVYGYVHVTGYNGSQVQATIEKRIYAETNEALQNARSEVKLDLSQQGDSVRVYVDGPFRGKGGDTERIRHYRVIYDCELQVPAATELALKNVNGNIDVKKTTGKFELRGVNGGLTMEDVAGAGAAQTVNGPLKVSFTANPPAESEFKTVNGSVDVYFRPGLNADIQFKTVNGGVFSDFEASPVPSAGTSESKNGRFVYRSGRASSARIGSGGPQLKFDTVNGPIRLHSKTL